MNLLVVLGALLGLLLPPDPVAVLHDWDAGRAAAWTHGDVAAVRRLYLPGSEAGEQDARLLAGYRSRGLVVRRLETQVLAVRVLVDRPTRIVLRVTDRIAVLEVSRGTSPVRLPRDRPQTRRVELRRTGGTWQVASVSE